MVAEQAGKLLIECQLGLFLDLSAGFALTHTAGRMMSKAAQADIYALGTSTLFWSHVRVLTCMLTPPLHGSIMLLNNLPITRAQVVGWITAVEYTSKFSKITIDDSTGSIVCVDWSRSEYELGSRVSARGRIGIWQRMPQLAINGVQIVDANAELLHILTCLDHSRIHEIPLEYSPQIVNARPR